MERARKEHPEAADEIALRDLPGIAEVEQLLRGGGGWKTQDEIQKRVDEVSISLFGVTEAQTRRQPIDAKVAMGSDRYYDPH